MLAVYPPLLVLVYASRALLQEVPMPLSLFLIALCLTGLSTGLIMPFLHRRLAGWMHR
jgi:antibiotic biosynthesis monooxygenase (ABM) superfamily enzyme